MSIRTSDVNTYRWTTRHLAPTVTPNVTLMGELPVVDAFQSHPFNRHLRREGSYQERRKKTDENLNSRLHIYSIYLHLNWLFAIMLFCWTAALSFNLACVRYWDIDSASNHSFALLNITQVLWLISFSLTRGSSIVSMLFKILNEIVLTICLTLSQ